jgi:hypothetical protein
MAARRSVIGPGMVVQARSIHSLTGVDQPDRLVKVLLDDLPCFFPRFRIAGDLAVHLDACCPPRLNRH